MSTLSAAPPCANPSRVRYYGQAEQAAQAILAAFQGGNLPKALAPVFIRRKDNVPCRCWSWSNQLLVALYGHSDARGYRQWEAVGRHVCKGQKGFPILVPLIRKSKKENPETREKEERDYLCGFKHSIVFGLGQTEGAELPPADPAIATWIESLPLVEVARNWGLSVEAFGGRPGAALGR
jgi:hypothetical protein